MFFFFYVVPCFQNVNQCLKKERKRAVELTIMEVVSYEIRNFKDHSLSVDGHFSKSSFNEINYFLKRKVMK